MAKIIIIGAGLTGLSTAYHLEQRGFFDYKIFEKDSTIGGLCRSVCQDGFTFDYTGHLLHASDQFFRSFIAESIGLEHLHAIFRRSYIFSQQTYTNYPYQINLFGLPAKTIAECIQGFVLRKKCKKKNISFYDWVLENFGQGFAEHFFIPFQSKIFDYDIKKVTATWMGRFVPNTSLEQIIEGSTREKTTQSVGYNAAFFYPKSGGINAWINTIVNLLKNPVQTNMAVQKIDVEQKVVIFDNGLSESYDTLITTMPLTNFLRSTKATAYNFKNAANNLLCNAVVNFNWGIAREALSDKHWIYFPEQQYPFYRIGFPHNFSAAMAPVGHSSLYGEFSYINKSEDYIQKKLAYARQQVKNLFKLEQKDIVVEKIIRIPHAYVIYNRWREQYLQKLLKELMNVGIYSIGRYGEWKYSSMQEAVLDGKKIAEKITILPATQAYYKSHTINEKQKEI